MDKETLQELIDEATVDCYDEYEQFWGIYTMLEDIAYPFEAMVLGDMVKVIGMSDRSNERRGMFVELEKRGKVYTFPMSELDVSNLDSDSGARVAAYKFWSS